MSLSGIIDANLRDLYHDGEDEMFRGLSLPCTLYYPTKRIICSNCSAQSVGNLPSSIARHGIPIPGFGSSNCPYCNGTGFKESQVTETVQMQVGFNPKRFIPAFQSQIVNVPGTFAQSKARQTDLPKILKCTEATLNDRFGGFGINRYSLMDTPIPGGLFQDHYIYILWKRNG